MASEEKGEESSVELSIGVPGGRTAIIKQAVGTCDGSTVKTFMLKVQEVDRANGVVVMEYDL